MPSKTGAGQLHSAIVETGGDVGQAVWDVRTSVKARNTARTVKAAIELNFATSAATALVASVIVTRGRNVPNVLQGGRGFRSFSSLKRALGSPGQSRQWHHIVEQSQTSQFGKRFIQNTKNIISIDKTKHKQISAHYSSKQHFTKGKTVREWLKGQSFEKQYQYGVQILRDVKALGPTIK